MTQQAGSPEEAARRAAAFERMERENRLFDARFDGWSPWRVMRNALHRQNLALPIAAGNRSVGRRVGKALRETLRYAGIVWRGRHRQVLVKTSRSGLRGRSGAYFRDVYFDGLLQRGYNHLKIEEDNSPDFALQARQALFPGDLDPVFFTFWGSVLGRLMPVDVLAFCHRVSDLLRQECGLVVDPAWLRLRVSTTYWQSRLYDLLLGRLRPRVVMVSDTGEYGLRLATFRRGIRFVELQHGVFDIHHPDAIPDWVEGTAGELLLPDVLACRGSYWVEQLAGSRQGRDAARPVGNEAIDEARAKRCPPTDGAAHLILSSQGLDSINLGNWLAALIKSAPTDLDWSLTIKLHPVYDAETAAFNDLAQHPRVRIVGGAETPNIFDLLAGATMHLSVSSACHFDAAALGVASVVVPLRGHEAMLPAVEEGLFRLAARPEDAWQLLLHPKNNLPDPNRFSTPGFIDNIERLIPSQSNLGTKNRL